MTGINHKQAQRYLRAAADGLLRENQRALLNAHLRECDSCRAEADELNALEARLKKNFQARWDAHDGPSTNVMTTIQSRSRRIIMTNRINTGLKTAAGLAALLLLGILLNSAIGKLRNSVIPASTTQTVGTTQSIQSSGLIAYVSIQDDGNVEIFTMKADGSEVKNLTNNPAADESPAWSPDGTRIAFTSDRSGHTDIYAMNADGSNVSRLTDDRGFEGFFSWSPDGQKIVYISSENSLNDVGQLIVMNVDGSNKIALTWPGLYIFLGWSPNGQKIIYQKQSERDAGIYVVDIDGANTNGHEWFRKGGPYQIHWEDSEQFLVFGWNGNEEQVAWLLERFRTNGDWLPPPLVTSNAPIVAIFDRTYVVENRETLTWFAFEGAPIPSSPWKFSEICKTPGDPNLQETSHFISPDKKHSFVSVYCGDDNGSVSFFLMNEDGAEIHQLGIPITNTNSIPGDVSWSPDGKYVTMPIADRQNQDIYLFDIEKMLNDPTTQPVQLTTDGAMKYGATWQPQLKPVVIKTTEEKSTPEPLTFSLTVQEAETLAGFDVLEPTYLPEGYPFQGADYSPQSQTVTLKYSQTPTSPEDGSGLGVIYIYQMRGDSPKVLNLPSHGTPAPVGDVMGEFTHGAWVYDSPDTTTPRWEGDNDVYSLSWQKDGISFAVDFMGGVTIPPIQLHGLTAIAESLKHVTAQTAQQIPPIGTDKSNGEWIAFIGGNLIPITDAPTDVNSHNAFNLTSNVYLIHPDGTGLMNLTNAPGFSDAYFNLQWSPNGEHLIFSTFNNDRVEIIRGNQYGWVSLIDTHIDSADTYSFNLYRWSPNSQQIAFIDNPDGNYDIYTMYADGRNDPQLTQLTNDPGQDIEFAWSPDGNQIAYQRLNGDKLSVYIMNADGSNQREVAQGAGKVNLRWSQDGMSIYASTRTENNWLDCETCVHKAGIYRIYLNEPVQVHQIHYEQDAGEVFGWYLYDTPQDTLYFMQPIPSNFLDIWGTWSYVAGNSVHEIGELDPRQTCKTTTGNILNEYISPNERFSIISDFCVGGFDLYLADREATTPEKQIIHLLRLPLSTRGQGGDEAYLPITWSPDGRSIMYMSDSGYGIFAYILDIEKALQDPTTTPTPLTDNTNLEQFGEFQWQPRP